MFRRLIYSILIVAFVWVIFSRSAEISLLAETLTDGNWDWVFAATGVEILYLFFFAFAYQAAFFTVEIRARFGEIFPVMLGSMFVNAVAPGGGVAGVALFVDDQSRRGHSGARATAGMVVHMIADFSSLTLILILSMTYLFIWDSLPSYGSGVNSPRRSCWQSGCSSVKDVSLFESNTGKRLRYFVETLTLRLRRFHHERFCHHAMSQLRGEAFDWEQRNEPEMRTLRGRHMIRRDAAEVTLES